MTDFRTEPGRYTIRPIEDCEWWGYWDAFIGELRVNGGVCEDYTDGTVRATRAIAVEREQRLKKHYYWDVETWAWVRKGELPSVS
jgi:hypothetical protein